MNIIQTLAKPYSAIARLLDLLAPLFDLGVRLWVAWVFLKSGLSKIQSWDSTLMLFEYEYEVPLLPPDIAAYAGTAAELSLPILVAIGLASRLSALALFAFNAVAVLAYSSFLFGDNGAAGLQQHIMWGVMLLITVFHGPGKLSLDHWLCKKC
jgi:putative oxidoreductase